MWVLGVIVRSRDVSKASHIGYSWDNEKAPLKVLPVKNRRTISRGIRPRDRNGFRTLRASLKIPTPCTITLSYPFHFYGGHPVAKVGLEHLVSMSWHTRYWINLNSIPALINTAMSRNPRRASTDWKNNQYMIVIYSRYSKKNTSSTHTSRRHLWNFLSSWFFPLFLSCKSVTSSFITSRENFFHFIYVH